MSSGQRASVNESAIDQIFRSARTQNGFVDQAVEDAQLRELYARELDWIRA